MPVRDPRPAGLVSRVAWFIKNLWLALQEFLFVHRDKVDAVVAIDGPAGSGKSTVASQTWLVEKVVQTEQGNRVISLMGLGSLPPRPGKPRERGGEAEQADDDV